MADSIDGSMGRQPTLQAVSWLINLRRFDQLDLDPPYQRRSVWSLREKQRFLDTVLRNYPSPAIFLHVTYDDAGNPKYHVVDGKQRLSTIFDFVENKIRLPKDFGDSRLDNANWKALEEYQGLRKSLWTYQLTVEQIDDVQDAVVREIFERINRNSRKLEPQEMRHARFDGWLITYLESQATQSVWKELKVATAAKARRMAEVQTLSELASVLIQNDISGFSQEMLDQLYADFEDPAETQPDFDVSDFTGRFETSALFLRDMEEHNEVVTSRAGSRNHLYPLWAYVALNNREGLSPSRVADAYLIFMDEFLRLRALDGFNPTRDRTADDPDVSAYLQNSTGASTEHPQRRARYESLRSFIERSL